MCHERVTALNYSDRMQDFSRTLSLTGASNFRDLGGYPGLDGRTVRWRRLFRSDHLAALTPQDAQVLAGVGLTRSVDFRGLVESAAQSYALPQVRYHALPIEPTVVQRAKEMTLAGKQMTAGIAVGLMQDTYRAFVANNAQQYAELFEHLLEDDAPLVFHCTAGKDRTGFAAALILMTLGVPRSVVMEDYLLTNALYRRPAAINNGAPEEVLNVLWRVQEAFLDAALQCVDQDFGGPERYLAQQLHLSPAAHERLKARYLVQDK